MHVSRMRWSTDDGRTWSDAKQLPSSDNPLFQENRFIGPEQNPPLEHPNGWFWCSVGAHVSTSNGHIITMIPPDNYDGTGGTSWQYKNTPFNPGNAGQGAFLVIDPDERTNGLYKNVAGVVRDNVNGEVHITYTANGGEFWTSATKLPVSNNIGNRRTALQAGGAAVSLDINGGPSQGRHLACAAGDAMINGTRKLRHVIRMVMSNDAHNWDEILEMRMENAEQADPTLIQTSDRKIHLLWSGRGTGTTPLRHVVMDPDILIGNDPTIAANAILSETSELLKVATTEKSITIVPGNGSFEAAALYTAQGKKVFSISAQSQSTVSTANLQTGMYIVRAYGDNTVLSRAVFIK
ncbi:MAG: T9SS type A sorting domain-containing protein [Chitinivibrionales bacterium]|nr:T9SS type A sorting domain-containing protein [Chitinivibrionales bacterium]